MSSFKKIASVAFASLLVAALPPWSGAEAAGAKAPKKEEQVKPATNRTLVKVNGTPITRLDLDRAVKVMLSQNRVTEPLPPETMKKAEEAALDQLTSAELLYQAGGKLEIKDLDQQVSAKVAQNRAKFKTEAEFEKALHEVDMTVKDMEDFTRKDIVISNLIEKQFADKAAVSETEAMKFYNDNLDKYFKKSETVRASHILIGSDEKANPEDRKKAKEKAEAILKRVKAGEDFAALAKAESTCPSSAQGGDLGKFGKGQMVPPFEKAAFALKPGEVSDVVETQFGYHIIKVTDKQEASTEKFDDVKAKIEEYLKREKVKNGVNEYLEVLKKQAKIEKI